MREVARDGIADWPGTRDVSGGARRCRSGRLLSGMAPCSRARPRRTCRASTWTQHPGAACRWDGAAREAGRRVTLAAASAGSRLCSPWATSTARTCAAWCATTCSPRCRRAGCAPADYALVVVASTRARPEDAAAPMAADRARFAGAAGRWHFLTGPGDAVADARRLPRPLRRGPPAVPPSRGLGDAHARRPVSGYAARRGLRRAGAAGRDPARPGRADRGQPRRRSCCCASTSTRRPGATRLRSNARAGARRPDRAHARRHAVPCAHGRRRP